MPEQPDIPARPEIADHYRLGRWDSFVTGDAAMRLLIAPDPSNPYLTKKAGA